MSAVPTLPRGEGLEAEESTKLQQDLSPIEAGKADLYIADESTLVGPRTTWQSLTTYQKKSVLVNRSLDEMGMGRYQYCIFFLCGFGFFLDLAWAQMFGLIASRFQQEFGTPSGQLGYVFTSFSVGLTVGAFTWGLLADIYGRKWCFNITCLIASVAGMLVAAPNGFVGVCVFTSFVGFGVGGNIPLDATCTLEFLPTNRRWLLAALSTFQPLGVVVTTLICYGFIPNYSCATGLPACATGQVPCCIKSSNLGWRYSAITIGCITLLIFFFRFVVFTFRESPKYLLSLGRDEQALEVVRSIAAFNKQPPPSLSMADFEAIDTEAAQQDTQDSSKPLKGGPEQISKAQLFRRTAWQHFSRLKSLRGAVDTKTMAWLSFTLFVAYISLFWAFTIAGGYLPIILADKGVELSQTLEQTYRSYIWIYLPGVGGTLFAAAIMEAPRIGRRWGMVISSAALTVFLFVYPQASSIAGYTGLNAGEYVTQSAYAALLYAFTPEAFPAPLRASACGILSTCGRLSGIVAPTAAASVYAQGSNGVLYMAGGGALLSTIAVALIPFDTKGKQTY